MFDSSNIVEVQKSIFNLRLNLFSISLKYYKEKEINATLGGSDVTR